MIFRKLAKFSLEEIRKVPREAGIYLVYLDKSRKPFYIGRSRCDIRRRLLCHLKGTGSKRIREQLSRNISLKFEWEEMISVEQAEAELIKEFFSETMGNKRKETDPAEYYKTTVLSGYSKKHG